MSTSIFHKRWIGCEKPCGVQISNFKILNFLFRRLKLQPQALFFSIFNQFSFNNRHAVEGRVSSSLFLFLKPIEKFPVQFILFIVTVAPSNLYANTFYISGLFFMSYPLYDLFAWFNCVSYKFL